MAELQTADGALIARAIGEVVNTTPASAAELNAIADAILDGKIPHVVVRL